MPGPADARSVGDPSVTIATYSGATDATASIQVQLLLVWPAGADQVTVTNGDGSSQTYAVADTVGWQLVPSHPQTPAQIRTVTVTYSGPGVAGVALSDTILLDMQAPRLPVQRLFQNGEGWFLATGSRTAARCGQHRAAGQQRASIAGVDVCGATLCPATAPEAFFLKRARPRRPGSPMPRAAPRPSASSAGPPAARRTPAVPRVHARRGLLRLRRGG